MHELPDGASLDELNAFAATAQTGSFTAAGKRLGRDASVVSRRVNQLEQRLGVRLLTRTTRSVRLTEAGAFYYQRTRAALAELDTAAREVTTFSKEPQGALKISLPVVFGREMISPMFPAFIAKYPKITLDAVFLDRVIDVVAEGYDIAIRVGNIRDSMLIARKIYSFKNILVASPDYVARNGRPSIPEDLRTHACLGFTGHIGWPDWTLTMGNERVSIRPSGPLTANNAESLVLASIAGTGISLSADWLAAPHLASGKLIRILPEWATEEDIGVFAVTPPGGMAPGKTRAFVEEIAQALKRQSL
ncbi:LysR family transcriptional regulator [Rhizobium rhizogenes]|uniref:LysR family transcriptional regulator n=1 Tax=Rhizobium rhizogenes TaxID=359 RepID=UPI001F1AA6C1|nr:LysR family transcriptional regulator [Rhizobium rhizogenes]